MPEKLGPSSYGTGDTGGSHGDYMHGCGQSHGMGGVIRFPGGIPPKHTIAVPGASFANTDTKRAREGKLGNAARGFFSRPQTGGGSEKSHGPGKVMHGPKGGTFYLSGNGEKVYFGSPSKRGGAKGKGR